jgi:hypothetical protein
MRQNLTLLVFLSSLYGFAQFYVQKGTTLSFGSSEALLSSQETYNQIDASLLGEGTLLLNSTSEQQLTSSQAVLELPTLHIKNADLVQIHTALILKDQLVLDRGFLQLSHTLTLTDSRALVLGETAGILTTPAGQLVYQTQFSNTHPLVFLQAQTLLVCLEPNSPQTPDPKELDFIQRSYFGTLPQKGYEAYFQQSTPPPKAV